MLDASPARRSTCWSSAAGITGAGVALDAATRGLRTALVEARRLRLGHLVEELQARPRRAALPAAGRRPPRLRGAPRAPAAAPQRPAPRQAAAVHDPDPHQGRRRSPAEIARALGSAMWMYDLTGGCAHRQAPPAARRPTPRSPTCRRCRASGSPAATSTTTPPPTTPGSCSRSPAPPPRTAPSSPTAAASSALTKDADGRVDGAVVDAGGRRVRRPRPRRRQRRRRVGRRGPRARRRRRPRLDPPGQGRPPHRAVGQGAQRHRRGHPGAAGQAQPVRRAVGSARRRHVRATPTSAPPTPTTTARSTTRSAPPTTSPTCSARSTPRSRPDVTADDVTGVWAGLRPLVQVGGSRAHRRPVPPPPRRRSAPAGVVAVTGGKLTTYREMAEDTVDAVLAAARRARPAAAPSGCRCSAPTATASRRPGTPDAHLAGRYGTLAGEVEALVAADPSLGEPLVAGLPYLRAEAVYAARHEMATHARRRADPAHPGPPVRPRRHPRRGRRRSPSCSAGELGWDDAETARQVADYRAARRAPSERRRQPARAARDRRS